MPVKAARVSSAARRTVIRLPSVSVDPPGIEPGRPTCHAGIIPLDHEPVTSPGVQPPGSGTAGSCTPISRVRGERPPIGRRSQMSVTGVGVEPTRPELSTRGLYQLAYPIKSGARESNPSAGLIRPGRASSAPRVADLGVEPSRRAYETQPSAGPSAMSGDGGIRTHTLRLLRPPPPTGWATSPFSDPWGSRTPGSALRGQRPDR